MLDPSVFRAQRGQHAAALYALRRHSAFERARLFGAAARRTSRFLGRVERFVFVTLFLVFAQTVIAGIAFPLLCHVGFTADDRAGFHLSLLYVGNILGSAAGSSDHRLHLDGFRLSTAQISALLAALGAIAAAAVAGLAPMSWPRRAAFIAAGFTMVISSPFAIKAFFDHYYERIIYKDRL